MGLLDHSTNNIIIDAALTDTGRKFLARNDGSFSIVKFALSDDEVDYTTIKKFGRQVGRERIAKLTPVTEAQTDSDLGIKFKLLSNSNPVISRMAKLQVTSLASASSFLSMTRGQLTRANTRTVAVEQAVTAGTVDVEFVDNSFTVIMNDRFTTIPDKTPSGRTPTGAVTYQIAREAGRKTSTGGGKLQFVLATRSMTDEAFEVYGNYGNKSCITSYVTVIGNASGNTVNIPLQIEKT